MRTSWNKGKKMSEEQRSKLSQIKLSKPVRYWLGKKRAIETIKKVAEKLKGNHNSAVTEFRKGDSPPRHQEDCKCFRCEKKIGKRNHRWKGGVERPRDEIRIKLWRTDVFSRDKYLCQMPDCDKTIHDIEAHHIKRFRDFEELRYEVSNGITLCKRCHNKTKGKEGRFEELFTSINKLKG